MMRLFILISFILLSSFVIAAQTETLQVRELLENQTSPPAKISDIAWLAGRWSGTGLDGFSEEVIAPPLSGQMIGMFRQTDATGSILFYEFYLFAEVDDSLVLRIKHFSSNFIAWEEKDQYEEFPLVAVENNAVYFDGLTYALGNGDTLLAAVKVAGQGIIRFDMPRIK